MKEELLVATHDAGECEFLVQSCVVADFQHVEVYTGSTYFETCVLGFYLLVLMIDVIHFGNAQYSLTLANHISDFEAIILQCNMCCESY